MDGRTMSLYAVILAGGTGTRLWPYSRRTRPKQLLPLLSDGSLLQATVRRLAPLVPGERVLVVTATEHAPDVCAQLPDLPARNVVAEPEALGTAAAIGLGAAVVAARDAAATMVVLPADHEIHPAEGFRDDVERAARTAGTGRLVTFGIPPSAPETGYGYIELGEELPGDTGARSVVRFVEKPDFETARRYATDGHHVWNSGMFAWTVPTILAALEEHLPRLGAAVGAMSAAAAAADGPLDARLAEIYATIVDRTTIDYGVMERSRNVACIPATFAWNDVGSWSALAEVLPGDAAGNAVHADHIGHETRDCLVFSSGERVIATVGLEGMIVVDTGDAVLVCPKDRAQDVKAIVSRLETQSREELL